MSPTCSGLEIEGNNIHGCFRDADCRTELTQLRFFLIVSIVPLPWRSRALFKVITSNAISTTDCISENVHKGKPTPELPQELFDMIVECAVEALRSGRDGMAVCKLMLTSCSIRYRLVRQFAPITIHEIDEGYATDLVDETVPLMYTYIIGAAQRYLVDSSEKRCSEHAPWQSPTNEEVATQLLSKLDGPISASVDLALDAVVFNGKLAHGPVVRQAECCFQRKGASVANILEAVDISFRELTHSFVKLDMALEESGELEHPAIMAPIVANPCQRALSGTFDAPSAHMHMSVAIFFRTGSKPHEILRKTRLLSTDISHEGSSAAASSSEDF